MADSYLLTCSCNRQVEVSPRQAGQHVTCECGQKLEAPTLSKMKQLPKATPHGPAQRQSNWGPQYAVMLAGLLVLAGAVAWGMMLRAGMTREIAALPDPNNHRVQEPDQLTAAESWKAWQFLKEGIRVDSAASPLGVVQSYRHLQYIAMAFGGLGVILVVGGFFIPKPRPAQSRSAG